jgi:hypothetical protein
MFNAVSRLNAAFAFAAFCANAGAASKKEIKARDKIRGTIASNSSRASFSQLSHSSRKKTRGEDASSTLTKDARLLQRKSAAGNARRARLKIAV